MSEQPEALRLAEATLTDRSTGWREWKAEVCAELRRQHSRIEADEALIRQALEAMQVNATWPFPKKREEAITALRTRLENSNAS